MTKLTSTELAKAASVDQDALLSAYGRQAMAGPSVVPFPRWQRARDRACAALLAGEDRLLLTGPAGTGKSALVQEIARILRYAGWHVTIRIAALQPDGAQRAPGRQQSVLFIDEADRLSMDELERLDAGGAGALVLAGLDEIGARWGAGARVSLSVLTPAEARAYIEQWLTMAGQDLSRFEPSAIERAVELGAGVPRLLSSLLCGTLWMRAANGSERVRREHVEDAAALRFCSREDGAESPEGAGSAAAAPRRDAHLAEQAQAHPAPSEPSPPAELSAELAPTQDARIADSPAAPRRRRVLVPALAASLAVLAAGGAVAVWSWPDETTQSGTVMQASIAELLDRARQSEPVTHPEPPLPERLAIVTPPQSEPPAAAAPLPTESSPPSAPKPTPRLSAAPARTNSTVTEESAPVPAAAQEPASSPPAAVQAESPAEELAVAAPEPPAPVMVKAVSAAEPPAPPQNPVPLSDALVETLVRRGNEMLALGDFSAARLLFGRAAQAGNVSAMLALGRIYDPASFDGRPMRPSPSDREAAEHWYRLAAAAGSAEAATRLQQIERRAAK